MSIFKTCTKCKKSKPPKSFRKRAHSPDGLSYQCKACLSKANRSYYLRTREIIETPKFPKIENLPGEEWRDVPGYEGLYKVSNKGRVQTANRKGSTGGILAAHFSYGYPSYTLYNRDNGRHFRAHQLVALAFIGPYPDGCEVNHIDGNRQNNIPSNLEYVTRAENIQNALDRGSPMGAAVPGASLKGSENPIAKLTEEDVCHIREVYADGKKNMRQLADRHGVTIQNIWHIIHRKTWKHVD